MAEGTCSSCRFVGRDHSVPAGGLNCRRYSPPFPRLSWEKWCGEYAPQSQIEPQENG